MAEPNMKVAVYVSITVVLFLHCSRLVPGQLIWDIMSSYREALSVRSYLRQVHKRRIKILNATVKQEKESAWRLLILWRLLS